MQTLNIKIYFNVKSYAKSLVVQYNSYLLTSRFSLVSLSPHIESPLHSARRILLIPSQLTRPVPQKESATTLVSEVIHRTRRMTTTVFLICGGYQYHFLKQISRKNKYVLYTGLFSHCVIFASLHLQTVPPRLEFAQRQLCFKRNDMRNWRSPSLTTKTGENTSLFTVNTPPPPKKNTINEIKKYIRAAHVT